jgi:predicted Rossmann fold nucleotide-binding protein DprA/Smf involved in DNA uptake
MDLIETAAIRPRAARALRGQWKRVSAESGVPYKTIKNFMQRPGFVPAPADAGQARDHPRRTSRHRSESKVPEQESLALSAKERETVKQIARRDGITEEEAATLLVQAALARRVRRRTGKAPAKVLSMRGRK